MIPNRQIAECKPVVLFFSAGENGNVGGKNVSPSVFGDPRAGINVLNTYRVTILRILVLAAFDRQFSAVGHGAHRVASQMKKNLLHLVDVHNNGWKVGRAIECDFNFAALRLLLHLHNGIPDERRDIGFYALKLPVRRECLQPVDQIPEQQEFPFHPNQQRFPFRGHTRRRKQRVRIPENSRQLPIKFTADGHCHFRGACMLYAQETRILFSGDLFGGIAASGLFAPAANWAGIKAFHELYMPGNDALRRAVKRIRQLTPPPAIIAPQHGGIITGELIELFLGKMEDLRVGLDIIGNLEDKAPELIAAINEILGASREMLGESAVQRVLELFKPDGSYPSIFALSKNSTVVDIKAEPFAAVESLAKLLFRECSEDQKKTLQLKIVVIFTEHSLPPLESALQ